MFENYFANLDPSSLAAKAVLLATVVLVALLVQRVVVRIASRAVERVDLPSASIFINVLRAIIWSFALLFVLQPVFGVEPTAFVTAIGVTSVALSLGLQDTLSNLIAGLSLMLTRIIVPGDSIKVSGFMGEVTDINWRTTLVKERGGNVEVIPNSVLSKSSFTKLTEAAAEASSFTVSVKNDADPAEVECQILEVVPGALRELADSERSPVVQFGNIGAYGTTVTVVVFMAPGVMGPAANDRAVRALMGMPWLAGVASDVPEAE